MYVFLRMPDAVKAYIDISAYWPKDDDGEPVSVNSVYQELLKTPNEIGRNTLRLALTGQLDRGHFFQSGQASASSLAMGR